MHSGFRFRILGVGFGVQVGLGLRVESIKGGKGKSAGVSPRSEHASLHSRFGFRIWGLGFRFSFRGIGAAGSQRVSARGLVFGVWCLGVRGLGFGFWDLGFGVWCLGFGVWCSGFWVWGLGLGAWGLEFGVWNLGSEVQGLESRVEG